MIIIKIKNILGYFIIPSLTYYVISRYFPNEKERKNREVKDILKKYPDLPDMDIEDALKKYPDLPNELPGILRLDPPSPKGPAPALIRPEEISPGGFLSPQDYIKRIIELCNDERALLGGVGAVCIYAVLDRFGASMAALTLKLGPSAIGLGKRKKGFAKLITSSTDGKDILNALIEGIKSKELTVKEKFDLIRKSTVSLLRVFTRPEARRNIICAMGILIVSVHINSGGVIAGAIGAVQDVFSQKALTKSLVQSVIDEYTEVNTPLPRNLAELAVEVGLFYNGTVVDL